MLPDYKYSVGDNVTLIDGRGDHHPLWVSSMNKWIGCNGVITEAHQRRDGDVQYQVRFLGQDDDRECWWGLGRWLEPVSPFAQSDELDMFFSELK